MHPGEFIFYAIMWCLHLAVFGLTCIGAWHVVGWIWS